LPMTKRKPWRITQKINSFHFHYCLMFSNRSSEKKYLLLVLTGLPTLSSKLVEARTYSERMFHTLFLKRLDTKDAKEAISRPVQDGKCPITFSDHTINSIIDQTAGYPYFIQFFCREVFDVWIAKMQRGEVPSVPIADVTRKLDSDFFHGRWARATDRQREL